jgi:hypothetical protein
MIWSFDLISWFLSHHIIIQFFMHERLDHEPHLLIWDDSYRQFLHQYVDFESSRLTIIQSRWFIQVEMISFIFTDFRDRREVKELENEYAILMRSDRSDNEARRHLDQKKKSLVTTEDFDSQKDLDESWDEKSVDEIVEREFLYNEVNFSSRLGRQQLAIHSFASQ